MKEVLLVYANSSMPVLATSHVHWLAGWSLTARHVHIYMYCSSSSILPLPHDLFVIAECPVVAKQQETFIF